MSKYIKINATTKTMCLIGHSVKQSFSPQIHNYLMEKHNIDAVYTCYDVSSENVESSIEGIRALGICGSNVTIPHKIAVMNYLDEVEERASLIGAVNTIKNENGKLIGYNTDGVGFVKSLLDKGYEVEGKNILILGAGGACRSISIELASRGAKSIEIRNRSLNGSISISKIIEENYETKAICSTESVTKEILESKDILINTTPIGMGTEECPIDKSIKIYNDLLVCDIVYKPHNTELLKWAINNELKVVHGIDMLINQGIEAFYLWTGVSATQEDRDAIKEIYNRRL